MVAYLHQHVEWCESWSIAPHDLENPMSVELHRRFVWFHYLDEAGLATLQVGWLLWSWETTGGDA